MPSTDGSVRRGRITARLVWAAVTEIVTETGRPARYSDIRRRTGLSNGTLHDALRRLGCIGVVSRQPMCRGGLRLLLPLYVAKGQIA